MGNIVVVSERPEDLSFAQKVAALLGKTGAPVDVFACKSVTDLKRHIGDPKQKEATVFWDIDHKNAINVGHPLSIGRITQVLQEWGKPHRTFLLSDQALNKTAFMFNLNTFSHYICRQFDDPAADLVARSIGGIGKAREFGIRKYLDEKTTVNQVKLQDAKDRAAQIPVIQNWLTTRELNPLLVTLATQAVDELLMNAIFDAPLEGTANFYRRKQPRNSAFPLKPKEQVTLSYGVAEDRVLISVKDQFGSLKKSTILGSIRRDYEKLDYTPPEKDLGAGLGIYGLIQGGMSLAFVVEPSVSTEVVLVVPNLKSMKAFRTAFRFFCFV